MSKGNKSTSNQGSHDDLDAFSEKLKAAQDHHNPEIDEDASGWAVGIRYASEFSAAVIVGGILGWIVDHFANTVPWGMFVGIILGFMAGTRNIVRLAKEMSVEDSES